MIVVATSGHRPDDERIYHKEIKTLLNTGYNILYCTRWDGDMDLSAEHLNHVNVSRSATPIKNYIRFIQNTLAEKSQIEILHIHEFDLLPLAKQMKKNNGIKVIYDVHDTLRAMWETFSSKKGLLKKAINKSLSFFEVSHLMYVDEVILANKVLDDNFYKQKGLNTTVVENFPLLDSLGEEKQFSTNPCILYQGQVSIDRGILVLLEAFRKLKETVPEARLKIIGQTRPLSFKDILKEKINLSGFENSITFLDFIPHEQIWHHIREAHIGVIPSLKTPRVVLDTPTKLFEYMAAGCAIVATDVPPVRHFLDGAGELVVPNRVQSLYKGILTILQNEDIYNDYINKSMVRVKQEYNWPEAEKKLLSVYKSLTQ